MLESGLGDRMMTFGGNLDVPDHPWSALDIGTQNLTSQPVGRKVAKNKNYGMTAIPMIARFE